jgi:heme/copper-type cytochrome/quinol oxidase subunit 2
MDQDTIKYDSLDNRPLPKWLTDQKGGLNTYQPPKIIMKEDKSIDISLMVTGIIIVIIVVLLTVIVLKKKKNNKI